MVSGAPSTKGREAPAHSARSSGLPLSSHSLRHGLCRDVVICVLLGLMSFLIYNMNLRSISAADTYAARYLPFSIWRNHTVVLDPIADTVAQGRRIISVGQVITSEASGVAWWIRKGRDDHLVSLYPIVVPVIIAPLYLPAVHYLDLRGWDPMLLDYVARIMEKLVASLLATASVVLSFIS